jgi:protein-disulfide isomerase
MKEPMPPIVDDDHAFGAPDAALLIVQYGDYDCPHTRASIPIIRAIAEELSVRTRFVFRHFPLRHLHADAQLLSEIAEASAVLGRFWEVHERLMGHVHGITQRGVLEDLRAAGLDIDALQRQLGSPPVEGRIEGDVRGGIGSGVHSTPTWFFNGVLWDGHNDHATPLAQVNSTRRTI